MGWAERANPNSVYNWRRGNREKKPERGIAEVPPLRQTERLTWWDMLLRVLYALFVRREIHS